MHVFVLAALMFSEESHTANQTASTPAQRRCKHRKQQTLNKLLFSKQRSPGSYSITQPTATHFTAERFNWGHHETSSRPPYFAGRSEHLERTLR
ncbi:hypothetical protein PMIN06_006933 [Paraphaeosphaeria minitans]